MEWSDTLTENSWSSTGVSYLLYSNTTTTQIVKAIVPAGTSGRRFVRLRVTQ